MLQSVKHLLAARSSPEWGDWRWQLREQFRSHRQLQSFLGREAGPGSPASSQEEQLTDAFRFAATPYYVSLIDPRDEGDPILRQICPDVRELDDAHYSQLDPLREETNMPVRGLTHRYPDRVLWYLSHNCAVYCRFCFRKRKVSHADSAPTADERAEAIKYIQSHRQIKEVILSGGDPLSLGDELLAGLLSDLRRIVHVKSIRIHSRMPVTLPMRLTDDLCNIFFKNDPITLVTHFNHAREITEESRAAVRRLRRAGVSVLNQSVLLRGINDTQSAQHDLLLGLVGIGVMPYYLHRCDEVFGLTHFRVPLMRGVEILKSLRGRLPGIALPRYVVDLPGGGGKIPVDVDYLEGQERRGQAQVYRIRSSDGNVYEILDAGDA